MSYDETFTSMDIIYKYLPEEVTGLFGLSISSIKEITHWDTIKSISLSCNTIITNEAVEYLAQMKNLEELRLNYTDIEVRYLHKIPHLKKLQISQHTKDIEGIELLQNLEELHLGIKKISREDMKKISTLPKLSTLSIRNATIEKGALEVFNNREQLTSVSFDDATIDDEDFNDLLISNPQLESLFLKGNSLADSTISNSIIENIFNLKRLTKLGIIGFLIEDYHIRGIEKLECLKSLYLSRTEIEGTFFEYLKNIREQILDLGLTSHKFQKKYLTELKYFTSLSNLIINNRNIIDEDIAYFFNIPNLSKLDLQSTSITNNSIKDLSRMFNLKEINLTYTHIDINGLRELQKNLPECLILSYVIEEWNLVS